MPKTDNLNFPESETWDYVIADGGLAGVIAAGELARRDQAVLIVEPRTALGHECTRSKCPLGSMLTQPGAGPFLWRVENIAREMARRPDDLGNPFLLEIALEKAFLEAGGKILYGATPCGMTSEDGNSVLTLDVATKSGKMPCTASRDILFASIRQGSRRTVVHGLLIIGAKNSDELRGVFSFQGDNLNYRIPSADGSGRTQIWLSWEAPVFDLWEAEKVLSRTVRPLIQELRSRHAPLTDAEIVYFWDEPIGFVDGALFSEFHWARARPFDTAWPFEETNFSPLDQIDWLAAKLALTGAALVNGLCAPNLLPSERVQ
jgi:hypothetical protein